MGQACVGPCVGRDILSFFSVRVLVLATTSRLYLAVLFCEWSMQKLLLLSCVMTGESAVAVVLCCVRLLQRRRYIYVCEYCKNNSCSTTCDADHSILPWPLPTLGMIG